MRTMKQIRIASAFNSGLVAGRSFATEWMAASLMNQWMLKNRLTEARALHGHETHWMECRDEHAPNGRRLESNHSSPAAACE